MNAGDANVSDPDHAIAKRIECDRRFLSDWQIARTRGDGGLVVR